MANLTCPGCGSLYPLEALRGRVSFRCAVCHQEVVVPIAGPAPSRAAPLEVAPVVETPESPAPAVRPTQPVRPVPQSRPPQPGRAAPPPAAAQQQRPVPQAAAHPPQRPAPVPAAPTPSHGGAKRRKKADPAVVASGVGLVVVVAVVGVLLSRKGDGDGVAAGPGGAAAPAATKPATSGAAVGADPEKDPAAWKALSAADRTARTQRIFRDLDPKKESALWWAVDFFRARDEKESLARAGRLAVAAFPDAPWAREALGHVQIKREVEDALAACPAADEYEVPPVLALKDLRKEKEPPTGKWWADAETAARVREVLSAIRAAEEELKDPWRRAIAKWQVYQRKLEVMRDHPAIHETVGPYLIFVQVKAPAGTPLSKVDPAEMQRAQRVLRQNVKLFGEFHEGWSTHFGGLLGLTKRGPPNTDEVTILKANVFADESTWREYNQKRGNARALRFVRAYYESDEPRFIVSHDGPSSEHTDDTDQVQCHEATHQIVHAASRELTKAASGGREIPWADCPQEPLWQQEGFAEFFSSHRREGERYVWMQPLPRRMKDLWIYGQILEKKKWATWGLAELLETADYRDMNERAAGRATDKPWKEQSQAERDEVMRAIGLMGNLFYARAWSLVHFCWTTTDAQGRPRWRDGYTKFLRRTLRVEHVSDPRRGLVPKPVTPADFRADMGLGEDDRFAAFEKAWEDWERSFVEAQKSRTWLPELAEAKAYFGVK